MDEQIYIQSFESRSNNRTFYQREQEEDSEFFFFVSLFLFMNQTPLEAHEYKEHSRVEGTKSIS